MFDKAQFKIAAIMNGLSLEQIAIEIGMNPTTLYRKMSGASDFTRCEMQNLRRLLKLSRDQFEAIFFAPDITET